MTTSNPNIEIKKFPLQGIGEYFEKVGKLSHAKHAYGKALASPQANEVDKANAKYSIKKLDEKLRLRSEVSVDATSSAMLPTKDLKPHIDTEMPMGSQDYDRLKKDIAERGIMVPLAINLRNEIICGIHRWKAAKELEIVEVPCFVLGLTDPLELKRYALADNVCRRQLSVKERKVWVTELLRLRKEETAHIRGRKPKDEAGLSNRAIAKATGVSPATVDRIEIASKRQLAPIAKKALIQREDLKDSIVKGKSKERDLTFVKDFMKKTEERAIWIFDNLQKGEKLQIKVSFEYDEKE